MHGEQGSRSYLVCATILLFVFCLPACPGPRTGRIALPEQKRQPIVTTADLEQRIHDRINAVRKGQGLPALLFDRKLAAIARNHSTDMSKRGYFSHSSPEGRDFTYRYRQAGYTCAVARGTVIYGGAENIALNNLYRSVTIIDGRSYHDWSSAAAIAESTVEGWMNSSGHRKNILAPQWSCEGIGVHIGSDDRVLITQNFC